MWWDFQSVSLCSWENWRHIEYKTKLRKFDLRTNAVDAVFASYFLGNRNSECCRIVWRWLCLFMVKDRWAKVKRKQGCSPNQHERENHCCMPNNCWSCIFIRKYINSKSPGVCWATVSLQKPDMENISRIKRGWTESQNQRGRKWNEGSKSGQCLLC